MTAGRPNRHAVQTVLIAGVFMLFCLNVPALGIAIGEYRDKADKARLKAYEAELLLQAEELDDARARDLVKTIRESFPITETVVWDGGSADVSNEWLLERVSEFEKETKTDARLINALQIHEYLSTVVFKIQELEAAQRSGPSKDEDKQKLAEILRREEYQKPQPKEQSAFSRFMTWILEWLEKLFESGERTESAPRTQGLGGILRIIIYAGLILLAAFAVFKLIPLIARSGRPVARSKKKDRVILGEKIADDETAIDLLAEAERLAAEGNLRGAIRKGYIALLCELSDRKVLGLARHKTNRDYLRDVRSKADLHPRMRQVTDTFERHWYGSESSAANDWTRFRSEYDETLRSI